MGNNALSVPVVNHPVVYYLIDDNQIVYIGSSYNNFYARINTHLKDKVFNKIKCIPCESGCLREIEATEIRKHSPKYNIVKNCHRARGVFADRKETIIKYDRKEFKKLVFANKEKLTTFFHPYTVSMWLEDRQKPTNRSILKAYKYLNISAGHEPEY